MGAAHCALYTLTSSTGSMAWQYDTALPYNLVAESSIALVVMPC
jgi:hypothetical protein